MPTIFIRRATEQDFTTGWALIEAGRRLLQASGSPQWSTPGYPNPQLLHNDLENGQAWLLIDGGQAAAIATLARWPEPDYRQIYDGQWLSSSPYTVIHRIAISDRFRGQHLAVEFVRQLLTISRLLGYRSCRADTYKDNHAMQTVLTDCGFTHCGTIYTGHNDSRKIPVNRRLAYEVILGT